MAKKIIIVCAVLLGVSAFFLQDEIRLYLDADAVSVNEEPVEVLVDKAMDLEALSSLLQANGVLGSRATFLAIGNYKKLSQPDIAIGRYVIQPKTLLRNLLNGFTVNSLGNGNAEKEVDLVLTSVRFLDDVCEKIAGQLFLSKDTLFNYFNSQAFLTNHGFTPETINTFFIPNTYRVWYDISLEDLIARLAKEREKFWNENRLKKLEESPLNSIEEVHTLASIVYAEQGRLEDEWPTIAGLYLNRIRRGMRLESDPTFKFCHGKALDTVQRLTYEHRSIVCDYNTYQIKGLPPGPINIPPANCLDAVLNAEKHGYIFMVAEPNYSSRHVFTTNLRDHNNKANIYRAWIRGESRRNR